MRLRTAIDVAGNEGPYASSGRGVTTYRYSDSHAGTNDDPDDINEQAYEAALDLRYAIAGIAIPFGGRLLGPVLTPFVDVIAGQLIDLI